MSEFARTCGIEALKFARRITLGLLEGIEDQQFLHRPLPGGNHAMWIVGHIACEDDEFLSELAGRKQQLSKPWHDNFGMGSTPSDDASAYPSIAEIKTQLASLREQFLGWLQTMPEARLGQPLPESWATFAPNYAAFMSTAACHEMLHAGQLTVVRRSLGLKPVFG